MICPSYCHHGGRCRLEPEHKGLHDSGYCRWSDAEAITKEAADAIIAGTPDGVEYLEAEDFAEFMCRLLADAGDAG